MNFNVLKTKALSKNQMRAIKGGSGTCGYKSPTGTVNGLLLNRRICLINCSPIHLSQP